MELAKSHCSNPLNNARPPTQQMQLNANNFTQANNQFFDASLMGQDGHKGLITPPSQGNSPPLKRDQQTFNAALLGNSPMSMLHSSPVMSQNNSPQMLFNDPMNGMAPNYSLNLNPFMHNDVGLEKAKFYRNYEEVPTIEPNQRASPYPVSQLKDARRSSIGGEKIHTCPFANCGRQFKRQEHLRRHIRSHTGEKPYTCIVPDCRRSFARSDHLTQHMRTHNDIPGQGMHGRASPALSQGYQEMQRSFTEEDMSLHRANQLLHHDFNNYVKDDSNEISGPMLNEQMDTLMSDLLSLDPDIFPNENKSSLLSH
jgi:hypothetical protein